MNEKNEGNQIHNFLSSSGSGTVINYGSGSDFLTSYGSGYGSGSTSQKVTVPTVPVPVPVPQHCILVAIEKNYIYKYSVADPGCLYRIRTFSIPDRNLFHPGSASKN